MTLHKPIPFYPVLVAAFPTVAVYALNVNMIPIQDVWRPLAACVVGALAIWALFAMVLRNVAKAAAICIGIEALFFAYVPLGDAIGRFEVKILEVVLLVLLAVFVALIRWNFSGFTRVSNFGASVLILLPLAQLALKSFAAGPATYLHTSLPLRASRSSVAIRPDIYFVIVDGYGRADQLSRVMGFSNAIFINSMRSRGFYIADQSHSNYCQTQLSLAATLNLDFLQSYPKAFQRGSEDRRPLLNAMDESAISAYLRGLGYTYVAVTSGFDEVRFPSADVSYSRPLEYTMLESTLLQLTPFEEGRAVDSMFVDRRNRLDGAFGNLEFLGKTVRRPLFVVAHIIAPHPPFVFGSRGQAVRQRGITAGFWDGSQYMDVGGTPRLYTEGYTGQVQWLNSKLIHMVDEVIPKSGPRPVVIIEGDHGSKERLDQNRIEKTDLHECFGNLMALYVPDSVRTALYPQITSVNTFRVLINGLFGEHVPLLPDRSFYSPFVKPYDFTEVTDYIRDR